MKLRNIIIALSAAIAFSACSKDDNNNPYADAKVKLSVKVNTSATKTKADDPNELTGEANINTLTALVFDTADGSKAGELSAAPNVSHSYTMEGIPAAELSEAKVVLIANAPASLANVSTYTEFEALIAELSAQQQSSLTMSTQVINARDLIEGVNDLGEIVLTRLSARIQIASMKTNFTRPLLVGRSVQVQDVYLKNVKTKSSYFSVEDWGKVQLNGNFAEASTYSPNVWVNNTDALTDVYYNYVMENLGDEKQYTTLLIQATLAASGTYLAETKWFEVVINPNGIANKTADHNYVKRNYVYKLSIAFGNNSFDGDKEDEDPEPEPSTNLDVQVKVIAFGDVTQGPDFD